MRSLSLSVLIVAVLFCSPTALAAGTGTIVQLQQFVSTSSPSSAITQATYGKTLKITGLSTGLCLTLDSNNLLTTTTCGSGGGSPFPFTPFSWGNATTSVLAFPGFISSASSTFSSLGTGGLAVNNGLLYNAATTTFNSPLNYSNGAVTLSTAGTWSGLAGTATALAADGSNCSAGSYPLGVDAAGAVQNCTVANLGTVTSVTGTYPIISSGGATPAISTAFSTTSNTGIGSGLLAIGGGGIMYNTGTSTLNASISGNAATVTLNANLSGAVTSSGSNATAFGSIGAGVLGTSVTGVPSSQATSSLYGVGTGGQVLGWNNTTGGLAFVATSSSGTGTVTSITLVGLDGPSPITTTGTISAQVGTSSVPSLGNLAYWTGVGTPSTLGTVATGTITGSGGVTATAGQSVIGSGLTIGCTAAGAAATGCLSSTDWNTFNNKSPWPYTINPATTFYGQVSNSTTTQMHYGAAGYSLTASTTAAFNIINVGSSTATTYSNAPLIVSGNGTNGTQLVIQNTKAGANQYSIWAVHSDIGTDTSYFLEGGCNNSGYSNATFSAQNQLDCFINASDNALIITTGSTTNPNANLWLGTGGTATSSIRLAISKSGYVSIGTTTQTSVASLTIASSTASDICYGNIIGVVSQWCHRVLNNGDYAIATTTTAGTATTTTDAVHITNAGLFGIGSTSPQSTLSIGSGIASSSVNVAEYAYGRAGNNATSTAATLSPQTSPTIEWPIGASATTLTLCTFSPGQRLVVRVSNPASTAGALTWAACAGYQLQWPSATIPAQTTRANGSDVWSFLASQQPSTATTTTIITLFGSQGPY